MNLVLLKYSGSRLARRLCKVQMIDKNVIKIYWICKWLPRSQYLNLVSSSWSITIEISGMSLTNRTIDNKREIIKDTIKMMYRCCLYLIFEFTEILRLDLKIVSTVCVLTMVVAKFNVNNHCQNTNSTHYLCFDNGCCQVQCQ